MTSRVWVHKLDNVRLKRKGRALAGPPRGADGLRRQRHVVQLIAREQMPRNVDDRDLRGAKACPNALGAFLTTRQPPEN